jgi:hypothetical protein
MIKAADKAAADAALKNLEVAFIGLKNLFLEVPTARKPDVAVNFPSPY